ncbi:hypothetical protein [Fibrobacter succinogenes]|uniref:hypothetical protein n=1 Tax=Fibrobacter succinogenes TaxID=833 RepID=UPI001569D196|nr:hypothetical protein [Fibrobacter succinogenes]
MSVNIDFFLQKGGFSPKSIVQVGIFGAIFYYLYAMISLLPILKNRYLPFLFALPLFLSVYWYRGIVMDAILYVTQYAYSIDPSRFLGDPAFDFGNQESLGFFSPVFGVFLERFGVSTGSFIYTLLMQLAWIAAFVFFIKSLLRLNRQRLWTLPVLILLACVFSNGAPFSHISWFHYLASYACSRSLSIALGLGGMVLLFNQSRYLSLLFILVGTAVHPLTAGWCLPFWIFFFFPKTKILVSIFSVLFPFSFLFHFGVFDTYPTDWLSRPLSILGYERLSIYVFLFVFFLLQIKLSCIKQVRNISTSMCVLIAIAFYWNLWGSFGEHILLYQVQPWRALWIPSLVAAPLGICLIKNSFRRYLKKRNASTRDLGVVLLVLSFFVSVHLFSILFASVMLLMLKERILSLKGLALVYGATILGAYLVQQYLIWCLQGFPSFCSIPITTLYHVRDSFFVYQFVFTVALIVLFLIKRYFLSAFLLFLSIFFTRFMLLPALPLFVALFPKEKKVQYWVGIPVIVLLIALDGLIDTELRNRFMTQGFARGLSTTCVMAALLFVSIYLSKKFSYKVIIACLLMCGVYALVGYGRHASIILEKEKQLDPYLHRTIFPQIDERGRVLFYVSGDYSTNPRLQFMTGSYLDEVTAVGFVFFKGHYRNALERSHLLYWKKRAPESSAFFEYAMISAKFAEADTLIDRVNFLCKMREIHHLVTDKGPLPFAKEDSAMVRDSQKVYLYACPLDGE